MQVLYSLISKIDFADVYTSVKNNQIDETKNWFYL